MVDTELVQTVASAVQQNCHISDARHARDYSLCIYLLKMREYFRWEQGYGFSDSLPKDELGDWLTQREQLWQGLEDQAFQPIEIEGHPFDPFDNEALNELLLPEGLVYSGGLGAGSHPHFFLGTLVECNEGEGMRMLVAGKEYARDITAPPAMSLGQTVFIRRESLRRMLWEKVEEWRWQKREGPMARALAAYPFDDAFDAALDRMTEAETHTIALHERGEVEAGRLLGGGWEEMLAEAGRSRLGFVARATRDHLADCLVTLPALIETESVPSLHFFLANLTGMRKALYPSLREAYDRWQTRGSLELLAAEVERGREHWTAVTREMLAAYQRGEEPVVDEAELAR